MEDDDNAQVKGVEVEYVDGNDASARGSDWDGDANFFFFFWNIRDYLKNSWKVVEKGRCGVCYIKIALQGLKCKNKENMNYLWILQKWGVF